jgi:hypothetical protein
MAASEYQWSSNMLASKLDELRNGMKKSDTGEISRRQFILLGTNAILTLSNPLMLVPEEIFPFLDSNIATCWQMSNGSRDDLTHTRWMLSSYLPTLTQLATQPSPHQKTAANQAAACYGLKSLLDYHLESLPVAEEDAKQFLYYSKLTEDPEWIVRAHVRFALISYYRGQPERALVACREADCYKDQVPPAALFSLYKEQASYEAQIGLKDDSDMQAFILHIRIICRLLVDNHMPTSIPVSMNGPCGKASHTIILANIRRLKPPLQVLLHLTLTVRFLKECERDCSIISSLRNCGQKNMTWNNASCSGNMRLSGQKSSKVSFA